MSPIALVMTVLGCLAPAVANEKTARLWEPIEWRFENSSWEGNPFDLIAEATFRHTDSKVTIRTGLFYAGNKTWILRFTGTRPGEWEFTTRSKDPELDGRTGGVTIEPNPGVAGFMIPMGNKWGRLGLDEAFVPQFVSYAGPQDYFNKPDRIDTDIKTWFEEHGFNGFHTFVGMAWFDLDKARGGYQQIPTEDPNPDPRTFEALELLIGKVHKAGGVVHVWTWGDEQRKMTPARWGINGRVDQRLQRYIGARLGPLPGWSMGYGFDLQEWVKPDDLRIWHQYMHEHMGWFHFLGGRAPELEQIYDGLDYSSYQQTRPTYDTYVEALEKRPGKPSFMEDRFRVRINVYPEKDYDLDMTRRGLWHSMMAGGVANIWAYLIDAPKDGRSAVYPNREEIRTWSRFWKGRFHKEMARNNRRTDGVCLEIAGRFCIFYKENTDSIRMDLTGLPTPVVALAVDTRVQYREIPLAALEATPGQAFKAPHKSDWVIAAGVLPRAETAR